MFSVLLLLIFLSCVVFIFIVTDFVSKFAHVYESFAQELQSLVDVYKQKTTDYGKDIEG